MLKKCNYCCNGLMCSPAAGAVVMVSSCDHCSWCCGYGLSPHVFICCWCGGNGLSHHVFTCCWCGGNGLSPHVFTCWFPHVFTCWWCCGNSLMCSPAGGAVVIVSCVHYCWRCGNGFHHVGFPGSSSSLISCGGCACGRCSCWTSTTSSSSTPARTWSPCGSPTPHR